MSIKKTRLDLLLLEKGFAESRERAQALIAAGLVWVNGERCDKGGHAYLPTVDIKVDAPLRYVSRGGLKLEKAVSDFGILFAGKHVLDVGASTGGFTDCALQNSASHVTAVDVGKGQIAWRLREDARVTVLEKTNIRYLDSAMLLNIPNMATVDVSFISLRLVLPVLHRLLQGQGEVIALIKPQFEAGRVVATRSRGVIKDPSVHREVLENILQFARELSWGLWGLTFSPLLGPEGNMEFLAWWKLGTADGQTIDVDFVIREAHRALR
ncbi:MAG: TlyA family RNA methyltransferase [Peptococcaceae bacterium]|nr:TlyA family RNA methyltransferase [Peptococcaceae bacterium]